MDKPFVVFAGGIPLGGWADYHSRYATLNEAQSASNSLLNQVKTHSWTQIMDVRTGENLSMKGCWWEPVAKLPLVQTPDADCN